MRRGFKNHMRDSPIRPDGSSQDEKKLAIASAQGVLLPGGEVRTPRAIKYILKGNVYIFIRVD